MQPYSFPHAAGSAPPAGMMAAMGAMWFVVLVIAYFWTAIPLFAIGKKLGRDDAWWAWIPIVNIVLMCRIAGKPDWWVVLFFIPLVNIVVSVLCWVGIASACDKPDWLGILMLVPVANLVIPFYLAFG